MNTFNNIAEFTKWYIQAGMPFNLTRNAEVFISDDATSSCVYRDGRFQVELYLIHPSPIIPEHEHPGVEAIEVNLFTALNDPNMRDLEYLNSITLRANQSHGNTIRAQAMTEGFVLLSAQHWLGSVPMSTIGSMWKGPTVGPLQEALIKRFNPGCVVMQGYADVTRQDIKVNTIL